MVRRLRRYSCFVLLVSLFTVSLSTLAYPISVDIKARSQRLTQRLKPLVGASDAVIVSAPDGRVLTEIHADLLLIPASIQKVLTALAALHYLGDGYRFPTDFFLTPDGNLAVKGYGDPMLISERVTQIAIHLSTRITRIGNLILDDSYFAQPIVIPGRHASIQPYDAPNGALCVNFNTVFFKRQNGKWVSAEPQTPLLPWVVPKIEASGLTNGRITLAGSATEGLRYTGELLRYFLEQAGIVVAKGVIIGRVNLKSDTLLWRYDSIDALPQIIANLLNYSNNFIANQLLLTMGATRYGPPATVDKGLSSLRTYYHTVLGIRTGHLAEASGLSRRNRLSARTMIEILEHFSPHHRLMRRQGPQWYKTGHLKGIRTRAGYLESSDGTLYRFVVMINTPGKTTDRVMRAIEEVLK